MMSENISLYWTGLIPDPRESQQPAPVLGSVPLVNGHIHTPHSFSAFSSIRQAFEMAREEGLSVLGINDFYTTDGYEEFAAGALQFRIFPLFNIEFIALQKEAQRAGTRVNDPVNPGRTYLSGKGLRFPVSMGEESRLKILKLQSESNRQTREMVGKLNAWLAGTECRFQFDAAEIQSKLAKNLLRERHIATAIRVAVFEKYDNQADVTNCLRNIYGGKNPVAPLDAIPALENEIRNNLLKAGGPAYVEEDEKAFLSLGEVIDLIRDAGGIPCYPVLLDDAKGNFTDFERDWERMADTLADQSIGMVELIPGRNDFRVLKEFVSYFRKRGFIISFGSEHNTPQLDPLTVTCRGGIPLDDELRQTSFEGAAIIAAHQYLTAHRLPGFPREGFPPADVRDYLLSLGTRVIINFTGLDK